MILNSWVEVNPDESGREDDINDRSHQTPQLALLRWLYIKDWRSHWRLANLGWKPELRAPPESLHMWQGQEIEGRVSCGWKEKVLALKPGCSAPNKALSLKSYLISLTANTPIYKRGIIKIALILWRFSEQIPIRSLKKGLTYSVQWMLANLSIIITWFSDFYPLLLPIAPLTLSCKFRLKNCFTGCIWKTRRKLTFWLKPKVKPELDNDGVGSSVEPEKVLCAWVPPKHRSKKEHKISQGRWSGVLLLDTVC